MQMDNAQLLLRMRNGEKKLLYAVAGAINATAKRIQQAEFENVRARFAIRSEQSKRLFFGSDVRPGGVAARLGPPPEIKAGRMYREVYTGTEAVGARRRVLLPEFEAGGEKQPTVGARTFAIPLTGRPARPSFRGVVPPAFTFAGLALTAYRGKAQIKVARRGKGGKARQVKVGLFGEYGRMALPAEGGGVQWKGKQRTFMLTSTAREPEGGVFQRIGRGREDIREIYAFRRTAPLDARLHFVATARATADVWYREEMEKQVIDALAHEARRA
jgi:hypothetical protein